MSDKTKAVNYTADQEALIIKASPLNYDSAGELGATMGKTARSIVAKALSLKCEYTSKPPPKKRIAQASKADLVADIAKRINSKSLNGLEKSTMQALVTLRDDIAVLVALGSVDALPKPSMESSD